MLTADCLMGVCVGLSQASLLSLSNGKRQLPQSEMMHRISMATPPLLTLWFSRGPFYMEPFVKSPTILPGSSQVEFKLAPWLIPRTRVYLTLCQKGGQLLPRCSFFVTSDSIVSQP